MAGSPILPRSTSDPTGQDKRERSAIRDFDRRVNAVGKEALRILSKQSYTVVTLNALEVNAKTYVFELDQTILARIGLEIERISDAIMLEGGVENLWFMRAYVEPAYQQGTGMTVANLAVQSEAYTLTKPTLDAVLFSEPYRKRISLLRAREFELMQGFTQQLKSDLAQTLTRGMIAGQNPRDIAKDIQGRTGVNRSRAERIARTEVTGAFRQARMDEAQAAQQDLGIRTKLMHISALSPTTRPSHSARHSKLFSIQEEREWWSVVPNMINCYLPGTKVAGRFKAGSKSYYSGPVVNIVTASGRNLSVTANHPVMTSSGLLPAAKIAKGDNLVAYGLHIENPVGVSALNDEKVSFAVEDVFSSLLEVGNSVSRRVATVDFHGDAEFMDKNINVVLADRVLTFGCDSKLAQSLDHLGLKHANPALVHSGGSPLKNLKRILLASPFLLSVPSHVNSLLSSAFSVAKMACILLTSPFKAGIFKPSIQGNSGYSRFIAYLKNGFSGKVLPVEVADVEFVRKGWRLNSGILEPGPYSSATNTSNNCEFLEGLSAPVFFDKVVEISVANFSGHVYDLEEVSGLMIAQNLIASNCRCSTVEILVNEKGEPLTPGIIERAKRALQK
jgi:SPP1 gp7 family putative phage head morphogenesis protein